jgi:hypothetical protein
LRRSSTLRLSRRSIIEASARYPYLDLERGRAEATLAARAK